MLNKKLNILFLTLLCGLFPLASNTCEQMESKVEKILEIVQDIQKKLFTGIPKEVAHSKSTYQSSTWRPQFPSSMAVDGSLQTIQHTDIQQNPYWVVDLGQMYSITSVEVYNEPNGNGERFRDVDILVGERHDNHMALCAHYVGPSHTGAHHVFDCNRVLQGKYVKITIKQRAYLHMAEVKVNALV